MFKYFALKSEDHNVRNSTYYGSYYGLYMLMFLLKYQQLLLHPQLHLHKFSATRNLYNLPEIAPSRIEHPLEHHSKRTVSF